MIWLQKWCSWLPQNYCWLQYQNEILICWYHFNCRVNWTMAKPFCLLVTICNHQRCKLIHFIEWLEFIQLKVKLFWIDAFDLSVANFKYRMTCIQHPRLEQIFNVLGDACFLLRSLCVGNFIVSVYFSLGLSWTNQINININISIGSFSQSELFNLTNLRYLPIRQISVGISGMYEANIFLFCFLLWTQ